MGANMVSRWTLSFAKRVFDFVFSFLGVLLLWPFFLVVAVLVRLEDGGPVFFRQERVGYKGELFRIWKFRTMVVDAERRGIPLVVGKDPRVTRIGYWLRKTKLDELPQLFNVLVGEMSFVGPRPEIPYYVRFHSREQRGIFNMRPGITSPASIRYKNEGEILSRSPDPERTYIEVIMPEKLRIDLQYFARATLFSDLCVIAKTLIPQLACQFSKGLQL